MKIYRRARSGFIVVPSFLVIILLSWAFVSTHPRAEAAPALPSASPPTFTEWGYYASGGRSPNFIATGDFDEDGNIDLAVTNEDTHDVSILEGNGRGGFNPITNFSLATDHSAWPYPQAIAVGDFNNDAHQDFIAVGPVAGVILRLGNGDGTFKDQTRFDTGYPNQTDFPVTAVTGDFNLDGNLDVAVVNQGSEGMRGEGGPVIYEPASVAVMYGTGTGSFAAPLILVSYPAPKVPTWLTVGDFNKDGLADLVVTNNNRRVSGADSEFDSVTILMGQGAGGLGAPRDIPVAGGPVYVITNDFNNDGHPDLAVSGKASRRVRLLFGNGTGDFSTPTTHPADTDPHLMAAGDLNGDGNIDLATLKAEYYAGSALLLGEGNGNFGERIRITAGGITTFDYYRFLLITDLNKDRKPDIVLTGGQDGAHRVISLINTSSFTPPPTPTPTPTPTATPTPTPPPDDATNSAGALQLSAPNYGTVEGQTAAIITVTRTGGTRGAVSATLNTADGTAFAGQDYTAASETVAFADGDAGSKIVTIPINDDLLVEGSETINLTLGSPSGGAVSGSLAAAILTIADNDACSYSIAPLNRGALPSGESFTVNVTAQSGCAWMAASNSSFISVTAGASGSGNGVVTLGVLSNGSGVPRLGTVTIAGQTLTVTQSEVIPEVMTLGFTQSNYAFDEGEDRATLTVTRTGNISGAASANYRTSDTDAFSIGCADNASNGGSAFGRCDFAMMVGSIDFAPGERQKTITVPLIDDAHDEGAETFQVVLSNPAGAVLDVTRAATVAIQDNDAADAPNPILTSHQFFLRQQYLDFLSREPDAGGFNNWVKVLDECPNSNTRPDVPSNCDRIYVSGEGFFRSAEFRLKGGYVFRFYKLAFNRLPEYTEIVSDMSFVAGATPEEVYARKAQLSRLFTERPEFQTAYGGLSNSAFVAALFGGYQLTRITTPDPAQPDEAAKATLTQAALVDGLDAGTLTRAQVFRAVADSDEVQAREFHNAFVAMQYYGYLRRKPEPAGYEAWLDVLRRGDTRTMVDGFINSAEYKLRFGR